MDSLKIFSWLKTVPQNSMALNYFQAEKKSIKNTSILSTRFVLTYAMDLTFKLIQPLNIRHQYRDASESPDKQHETCFY